MCFQAPYPVGFHQTKLHVRYQQRRPSSAPQGILILRHQDHGHHRPELATTSHPFAAVPLGELPHEPYLRYFRTLQAIAEPKPTDP